GEAAFPSVAKQGWRGHQVDVRVRLEAQPGMSGAIVRPIGRNKEEWLVQPPIIGGLTQPPRLRPLRRLRGIFLMGAATPPCPRRGLRLSLQLFSMPPCPAKMWDMASLCEEVRRGIRFAALQFLHTFSTSSPRFL